VSAAEGCIGITNAGRRRSSVLNETRAQNELRERVDGADRCLTVVR
jgi:hypothetical protein